jgi:hypothetical protein
MKPKIRGLITAPVAVFVLAAALLAALELGRELIRRK